MGKFLYYHGESQNPYPDSSGKRFWWNLELYASEQNDDKITNELSDTMWRFIHNRIMGETYMMISESEHRRRCTELYRKGWWNASYVTDNKYTLEQLKGKLGE